MKIRNGIIFVGIILLCLTTLQRYNFAQTGQAVDSWVSMANFPSNTFADGISITRANYNSLDYIFAINGNTATVRRYDVANDNWISISTPLPANIGAGGTLIWDGNTNLYVIRGGGTNDVYMCNLADYLWVSTTSLPVEISARAGTSACRVAIDGTNYIYFLSTSATSTNALLYRYNTNNASWEYVGVAFNAINNSNSTLCWDGGEYLYAARGGYSTFYRFTLSPFSSTTRTAMPQNQSLGGTLIAVSTSTIYKIRGGSHTDFFKYDALVNNWSYSSSLPATVGTNNGDRMAVVGDYVFALRGVTTADFWRYRWRDVDVPGKITSFVAETGTNGGEINLSWVSPGNDGYVGALPSGSTFYIQYASWTGVNFSTTTQPPAGAYHIWIPTGPVTQGTTVYYTVGGLYEGVTYYFRIWAKDNAGNWSEISDGATAWAQLTPLASAPTLSITVVTTNTITLSWTLSDAATYWVEYSTVSSSENWLWRSSVPAPGTSYQDVDLQWGTTYWYRLIAVNSVGRPNYDTPSNVVSTITYCAPPQNFIVQTKTATSITWSWTPVGFSDGFRIYQSTSPETSVGEVPYNQTTFVETNLSTNTAYGRFVRAYNIMGESLDSNHTTVYTLAAAPQNLQITSVYSSSVTLSWESGGNPSGTRFGLAYAEDENFTVNITTYVTFDDELTSLTTSVKNLSGNTTYYFRLWAYNGDKEISGFSNVVSTKTLPGIPSTPGNLYGVALSTVSIKWEWSIVGSATYYQLYAGDDSFIANLEGNGNTTYIEINLSSNTQYTRYVKSGNEYGISLPSASTSTYTLAYPPETLNVITVSSSTINLSWNYSGASKYQIWYSTDLVNNFLAGSVDSPVTNFSHKNLEAGVTYYYKIIPVNGDDIPNLGFDFPTVSIRTLPSVVSYFSTQTVTTNSITWEWNLALGADGYKIYRATDNSLLATITDNLTTTYTETELSPNTAYGRYIRAYNTSGEGEISSITTFYTLANPPSGLEVISVTTGSVNLVWQNGGNPSGTRYEVSYSTDNFVLNFSTPVKLSDGWVLTSTTVFGLKQNTTYYFRVRAFNGNDIATDFANYVSTKTNEIPTVILINEGFENIVFPPVGWINNGWDRNTTTKHTGQASAVLNSNADTLVTPFLDSPVTLTAWCRTGSGLRNLTVKQSTSSTGPWTSLSGSPFTVSSTAWTSINIDLTEFSNIYIQFGSSGGSGNLYLDDVIIRGLPDTKPPSGISNLTASPGTSEGKVRLEWSAPSDNDDGIKPFFGNYVIKYSSLQIITSTDFDSPPFEHGIVIVSTYNVLPNTNVSYILNLTAGTSYWFAIKSTDTAGNVSVWRSSSDVSTVNIAAYGWAYDSAPPSPTNLTATPSEESILLTWDAVNVSDLDYYELFCDSTTPYDFNDAFIATTTKNTSFLHTGLENYVTYYYRVRAVDLPPTVLFSEYSDTVSTYPVPTIPFAPSLSYDLTETTTFQIKWILTDNSTNEKSLHISTDTTIEARIWSSDALLGYGNTTSYIETGFTPNQQVVRYAEAYNDVGSSWSVATTVWTKANVPSQLKVESVTNNSVTLSWSNNNNPSGTRYEVSYSTDSFVLHFSTPVKLSDGWVNTTATIGGLEQNTTYYFRVRAFNGNDIATDFANYVSTKTNEVIGEVLYNESFEGTFPPDGWWTNSVSTGAVQSSTQKRTGSYSVQFNSGSDILITPFINNPVSITFWLYATSTASFYVEYATSTTGPWSNVPGSPITTFLNSTFVKQEMNLYGLSNIFIRFRRGGSLTYYLDDVIIIGIPETVPPANISNLTALTGTVEGSVILTWTSPGDDGDSGNLNNAVYRIKYSTTSFTFFSSTESYSIQFSTTGVSPNTSVSYTVFGLNPGTTYYFAIITRDDAGNWSIWTKDSQTNISNYASALDLPPSPPGNISIIPSNREITLFWSHPSPDPGDIDKYFVYQATFSFTSLTDGDIVHIATVSYPATNVKIAGLTNGVTYYYRLKSVDKGDQGNGLYSIVYESELSTTVSAVPKIRPASNLVATHYGTSISLSWTHSPDYTADNFVGYNIYRSESESGSFSFVGSTTNNTFVDTTNIVKNKTYYYIVRSVDTLDVESENSNIATAIPDLIPPEFVVIEKLTTRSLGKSVAKISLKVVDDRYEKDDREGKIVSLSGKYRKTNDSLEHNINFNPEFVSGVNEYLGEAEFDFSIIQIGTDGVEYYLVARDEVNISSWPADGSWYKVEPPSSLPEQKFISVSNPEIVFGKEVQEVVIRDYSGNELWKGSSDGGTKLIIWRGEDKQNRKIESGGYIYEIKTSDGKKKYGVVVIVK